MISYHGLRRLLLCFVFSLGGPIFAESLPPPPPGGCPVTDGDILQSLRLQNSPVIGDMARITVTDAPDGVFKDVLEINTRAKPPTTWSFQPTLGWSAGLKKGDVVWITFWARALETSTESATASTEFITEINRAPNTKLTENEAVFGRAWTQFAYTFVAEKDYAKGELLMTWRCGYSPQKIQLGGIQVLNFGPNVAPISLPHNRNFYIGMEADAAWRKDALERIEKIRKAPLSIAVTDGSGKPVSGATVSIKQTRSSFGFGSCVTTEALTAGGPDGERYRAVVKQSFNKVVFENDLKWPVWEETWRRQKTLDALHWLHAQNILVRGHNLVWPSWRMSPKDLVTLKNEPALLRKRVEDHIREEVAATRGLISDWDVVNEPAGNHDLLDVLGQEAMVDWFRITHETDPVPVLYLNDYAGLVRGGDNTPHKDQFEKTLRYLIDNHAPIGGVGIQAHFGAMLTPPVKLLKELDRWAALGLDIQITEFDINTYDEAFMGQYTRDFMIAVFSHPSVNAVLTWGFWEKAHYMPKAALYRADWSLKPNGEVWNDLVLKQWRTNLDAKTGADGMLSLRGFLGDYEITVVDQGKTRSQPLTLGKDGALISIKVE